MPLYGVDVSAHQKSVDWKRVKREGFSFGIARVSIGQSAVDDYGRTNLVAMRKLDGFVAGAYHLLTTAPTSAQVDNFLRQVGDVDGLLVVLDVEAYGADERNARAWVDEFKKRTDGHPVLGYYPRWYWERTGRGSLEFFDALWTSHYVSGSGPASTLYEKVPASYWDSYGGAEVAVLQFSSSATGGGEHPVDVDAFRGSPAELRAFTTGDDMALTAKEIFDAVWNTDAIPGVGPDGKKTNWRASSMLSNIEEDQDGIRRTLAAMQKTLADVAKRQGVPVDVDEVALARELLTALTPGAIADAVVDGIGADLAAKVVDELAKRLGKTPS